MKKTFAVLAVSAIFALSLVGCSSSSQQSGQQSEGQQQPQQQQQAKDFDGSAFEETSGGTMYLATAGGTSENGNVPQIVGEKYLMIQIEMRTDDFNGEICTIYIDGMELEKTNVGTSQLTLNLEGDMLSKGVHTVELVRMDGDTPSIYKKASYEIV